MIILIEIKNQWDAEMFLRWINESRDGNTVLLQDPYSSYPELHIATAEEVSTNDSEGRNRTGNSETTGQTSNTKSDT